MDALNYSIICSFCFALEIGIRLRVTVALPCMLLCYLGDCLPHNITGFLGANTKRLYTHAQNESWGHT